MAANIIFKIITAVGAVLSTTHVGTVPSKMIGPKMLGQSDLTHEDKIRTHSINLVKNKISQLDDPDLKNACSTGLLYDQENENGDVEISCKVPEKVAEKLKGGGNMLWMKPTKTKKRKQTKKRSQTKKRKPAKKRKQTKKRKQKKNRKSRRN
jgi:hypothetical protein